LACELYDQDDLDMASLDEVIVPYLEAWIKFKKEAGFIVSSIEQQMVHPIHRYAGTIDRIGYMGLIDKQAVLDIKCVAKLSPVTGLQTAAYKQLIEQAGQQELARYSLRLRPNGQYELQRYDEPDDIRTFLSLLNIFYWRQRHAA